MTHEQKPTRVSFRPWQGLRSDAILQRLFANTATLLVGRGARAIINLAATALAVRAIGLEAFGLTVLVHTYTRIVSDLSRFQSWQAVIRYGAEHNRRGDRYGLSRLIAFTLRLDLLAAGAGMAIALVVAPLAGPLLQWPPGLIGAAQVYAIGVVFMVTATPTGLLRLFDRFDLLALQSTVNAIVRLAGAAGVLVAGGGLYALLGVWFASVVAAGLVLAALAIREARRQSLPAPPLAASWRDLHEGHGGIWSLVIVTNINTSLALSLTHAGTLLVGGLLTPSAAALYHIAREIAGALAKPIQLLGPVIYPEFARLAAERDYRRIRTVFIRASILIAIGVGGVMALVALAGHWLLTLMAGEAGAAAYALLLWLALASAVALMTFALEPLLISVSRQNAVLGARACEAVLFFVASLVLIGAAGLEGAGLAALLARLTGGVLLVVFAREWWRSLGADVG